MGRGESLPASGSRPGGEMNGSAETSWSSAPVYSWGLALGLLDLHAYPLLPEKPLRCPQGGGRGQSRAGLLPDSLAV